jgi:hypothetical protein
MPYVVLLPGIMGVSMKNPRYGVIWPPGMRSGPPISNDELVDLLLDERTKPEKAIRRVPCAGNVYGPLLNFLVKLQGVHVATFDYDWRKELSALASDLATLLDDAPPDKDIVIVAHSMGGLIARWMLESGQFTGRPWFHRIKHFVAAAVPHRGAPLALLRLLGLSGINCVILPAANMKRLGGSPDRYPSGYQLLPAPGYDCYEHGNGTISDLYTAAQQGAIPLKAVGITAVSKFQEALVRFDKPAGITYHVLYGDGFETVTAVRIRNDGKVEPTVTADGDGTVPATSANPPELEDVRRLRLRADHMGFLCHAGALDYIGRLLGAPVPRTLDKPATLVQAFPAWRSVRPRTVLPVMLSVFPKEAVVNGTLTLVAADTGQAVATVPVASGATVDHVKLTVRIPNGNGPYRLVFSGTPAATADDEAVISIAGGPQRKGSKPHEESNSDREAAMPSGTGHEGWAQDASPEDSASPFSDSALDRETDGGEEATSTLSFRGGTGSSGDITPEDMMKLRPHLICLEQGRFLDGDGSSTSREDVDVIFTEALPKALEAARASKDKLRIVFYAHGGLVSHRNALIMARNQAGWWKDNHVYPLFFIWKTGLFESIGQILSRSRTLARPATRDLWDYTTDPMIEEMARTLGGPDIWSSMKRSAERAVDQPDGGAFYVAEKLKAFCTANADDVEVHAVGHSAGSIFHAYFVPACLGLGVPEFRTLTFLAPAIRVDSFKEQLTRAPTSQGTARSLLPGIGHLSVFTMRKDLELADNCAGAYRKSLLYLIHHALEPDVRPPILGLEVSLRADRELAALFGLGGKRPDRADVVWATTDDRTGRSASWSRSHGGFDNDAPTMNSVLRRVCGLDDADEIVEFPAEAQERDLVSWQGQSDLPEHLRFLLESEPATAAGPGTFPTSDFPPPEPAGYPPVQPGRPAGPGRRRALCVGIDRYRDAPLFGCVADSRLWGQTLQRAGFEPPVMLLDEQGTASNILRALRELVSTSRPGDSIVFQYSGHGTQVPDLNGDETTGDSPGMDEALCPIDYSTGAFVIDDDIGGVFDRLPNGVALTCFIDCCHSGTISRFAVGPGLSGRSRPGERARYMRATPDMIAAHRRFRAGAAAPQSFAFSRGRDTMREVVFAACLSTEVAYENDGQGDFTRHATRILQEEPAGLSNGSFLERVTQAFGTIPRQHPGLYCKAEARSLPLFGSLRQPGSRSGGAPSWSGGGFGTPGGSAVAQLRHLADLLDAMGG